MKKQYVIITGIGILVLLCITLFPTTKLSSTLILDQLSETPPTLALYYSDISGKKVKPYMLSANTLSAIDEKYIAYTEGFLPKGKYTFYMKVLSNFAAEQGILLPSSLHDFYENDNFVVMSFSGTLKDIYIIEKSNLRVHPLSYKEQLNLGPMYISHVEVVDNLLVLLGGEAHNYNAFIYKVYLPTFEVVDAIRLATHPSAIEDSHFTLTTNGYAAFINGSQLKVYDIFEDTYSLIPLAFEATHVASYDNLLVVLGASSEGINYTLIDDTLSPIATHSVALPAATCQVVDLLMDANSLYLLSYDAEYKRFMNYLSIYDLSTGNLTYTLGLSPYQPYALLGGAFY